MSHRQKTAEIVLGENWDVIIMCEIPGVTKHRTGLTGLTDRTGRKLPHRRLKPAHQPQRLPNKGNKACFPTLTLS